MSTEFLSCAELVELVTEYLEGWMPVPERLRFEEHIAICPPCRGYLAQMRKTLLVAGELTEDALPPRARDAMLSVFRDWKAHDDPGGCCA